MQTTKCGRKDASFEIGKKKVISMSCSDAHGGGNVWASFRINKKAVTFITEVYL